MYTEKLAPPSNRIVGDPGQPASLAGMNEQPRIASAKSGARRPSSSGSRARAKRKGDDPPDHEQSYPRDLPPVRAPPRRVELPAELAKEHAKDELVEVKERQ